MKYFNNKGIFLEDDFILNYHNYNITAEEAMFYIQLNYISQNGNIEFNLSNFANKLKLSDEQLLNKLNNFYNKKIITINSKNKIIFLINHEKTNYFTLKELVQFVERNIGKLMTSKETDLVYSWIDKKYTKNEIIDAFNISNNIHYVNGILNNVKTLVNEDNEISEDDILKYDWLN